MILFENEVIDYLDNLVFELYDNEYFGFIESSDVFVIKLVDFIHQSIETFPAEKHLPNYNSMVQIIFSTNQINKQHGMFFLIRKAMII